jgi:asparagine N-glycosylation enzyme membrane subunit Stt3
MPARRLWFWLGLTAAVALGFWLRLSTRAQLHADGKLLVFGSDDAYHLRRATFAAAHFPKTILFDPMMNFPDGGVPIWPPLYDLVLAAPALLSHGASAGAEQVAALGYWVPPALAGAAILLAGLLGRRLYGAAGGLIAALFVAMCPAHILWTQYGHTDQHAAESAAGMLALWAFVRSRDRHDVVESLPFAPAVTPGTRLRSREILAGLALAVAVLTWQGAIFWGAIFALTIFLECLLLRRGVLRPVLASLALPALLTAAATAAWLGPRRPPLTYVSFGFFQPMFLGALAAGTLLLGTIVEARRGLSRQALLRSGILLAVLAAGLLPWAGDLWRGLSNGVGYVLGTTAEAAGKGGYVSYPSGWLKGIFEARPLLADGIGLPMRQLSAAFLLSPFVVLVWARRVRRGPRQALHLTLAIWGAVVLLLALSQRVNVPYAAPLAAFCLLEAVRAVRENAGGSSAVRATALTGAAALVLLAPMASGLRRELSAVYAPGSDLFDTLDWMRRELPRTVDPYDARLLEVPPGPPDLSSAGSVLAPWSLGHLILYRAGQPVVANNFGYGFLDSIRFFLAESEREALEIADRHRVRWVVVTDLVPRMNDYAGYVGRPPTLRPGVAGPEPTVAYFRTMQSRLYDFDGKGATLPGLEVAPLARFRLVYSSKSAIPRGGRWLARWKVFEVVRATGG